LRVLRGYASYYHASRTHRSLDYGCPDPRPVEPQRWVLWSSVRRSADSITDTDAG
jgi:hypothetical protein